MAGWGSLASKPIRMGALGEIGEIGEIGGPGELGFALNMSPRELPFFPDANGLSRNWCCLLA
jgi:hypothetical protein